MRRVPVTAVVAAGVCAVLTVAAGMQSRPAPPAYETSRPAAAWLSDPPVRPSAALFVGDSYAGGWQEVPPEDTFVWATASRLGWVAYTDALGGTGYLADGSRVKPGTHRSYSQRLANGEDADVLPDVVIVTGGRNDTFVGRDVGAAARAYLRQLRGTWPKARIVVVEPFWVDRDPPAPIRDLRAKLRAATAAEDALWVPTGTWLDRRSIGSDGVHPSPAGHARIARLLARALEPMAGELAKERATGV